MIYSPERIKSALIDLLQAKLAYLGRAPRLDIVQIGDDFASNKYIQYKQKMAESLGIQSLLHKYDAHQSFSDLKDTILNLDADGVIVQLPLPNEINTIVNEIPVYKDVDMLGEQSPALLKKGFLPPTIQAIDLVLKDILSGSISIENFDKFLYSNLNLAGKIVAVVGQGKLVGSPLLNYLKERKATIISINEHTPQVKQLTLMADIVICAAGKPKLVNQSWFKEQTIVIDASTSEDNGQQVGDVDKLDIPDNILLCPSPGGIGRLTILCLFLNLINLTLVKKEENINV